MLTYDLKKQPGVPLYEGLYRCIREDILSGKLAPGQKLPSKRALADHLEVSRITVEGAYDQLLAEGFIRSQERVGYFVEAVQRKALPRLSEEQHADAEPEWKIDLTANASTDFPFSVWSSLQRKVMLDLREGLLLPMPNRGIRELRRAIAAQLRAFRGMEVDPENILVGAGTAWLTVMDPTVRILPIALGIFGYTYGSLLGVFLLGMLTRRRGCDAGNVLAMLAGFAVVILLEVGGRQGWVPAIAFPWRVTVGTLATFAVGCLFRTPDSLLRK